MQKNTKRYIKRHIKTVLSVIGLFSFPFLLYFLVHCLGLLFALFLLIIVSILAVGIVYKMFYDEFE